MDGTALLVGVTRDIPCPVPQAAAAATDAIAPTRHSRPSTTSSHYIARPRGSLTGVDQPKSRQISLLFDVFVVNQRLRSLLTRALEGTGLRPDEYAVYSAFFEIGPMTPTQMSTHLGIPLTTALEYMRALEAREHAVRGPNPRDNRSYLLRLTEAGLEVQRRASRAWSAVVLPLEASLSVPADDVRLALHALEDATVTTLDALLEGSLKASG